MTLLVTGNAKAALSERKNDLYETPPEAVQALLACERPPMRLWEPACGPGSMVRVLRGAGYDVLATDLVDYSSADQDFSGVDFLIRGIAESYGGDRQGIVTNPPFKNAQAFVERALDLVPYVAMLLRLAFIESEARRPILDSAHLARVHVFRNRLPMMHRDGYEGARITSGAIPYAWFVWQRGHMGPAQLNRISWVPS